MDDGWIFDKNDWIEGRIGWIPPHIRRIIHQTGWILCQIGSIPFPHVRIRHHNSTDSSILFE